MSFNRLNYDTGTYKKNIDQSVAPGFYHLNQPPINCEPCYPYSPSVRLQRSGGSVKSDMLMIDVDSELSGLFRKNSNNPSKQYKPCCPGTECGTGEPCGPGVANCCKNSKIKLKPGERYGDQNLLHWKDCFDPPEDTRLSNPPCTLRGTGINRFDWLCVDPQKNIEIPFQHNICNRIIVKDNHRPIIPTPLCSDFLRPKQKKLPIKKTNPVCANNTDPASVNWRCCSAVKKY